MAEPAYAEAPECTPYDPSIVGPPAPDICDPEEMSESEEVAAYTYMGTGEADPTDAFAHYAEDDLVDDDFDPADVGVDDPEVDLEGTPPLAAEDRDAVLATPVDDMSDNEFKQMLSTGEIDPEQMQKMLDGTSVNASRKLELWKKLQIERDAAAVEEECPESEVGEDPDAMEARVKREEKHEATKDELAMELKELPANYTMKDVEALMGRKNKEYALEQQYGISVTAANTRRADGSRVMWTEDELDEIKRALDQVPPELFEEGRVKFDELSRVEDVWGKDKNGKDVKINADCHRNGTIRMGDLSKLDVNEKREMKSPEFEAENGLESTPMERVMLHELGHAVNHGDPSTETVHDEEWKKLPGERLGSGEYFAQDFNHALTAPTTLYEKTFNGKPAEVTAAKAKYKTDPSPENRAALESAEAEAKGYPEMYKSMRNNVFKTDVRENEIAAKLEENGYTKEEIAAFRADAFKVSTPAQLDELARRNGYDYVIEEPED